MYVLQLLLFLIAAAHVPALGGEAELAPAERPEPPATTTPEYEVVEVVDGDTIRVDMDGTIETVRLIGVDAPEKDECYGPEASETMRKGLIGHGVQLVSDQSQDDRDVYGRLLRYVWHHESLLNEWLLRYGYAEEYTFIWAYSYQDAFKAAEQEAKDKSRGLWAACE